MKRDFDLIRKLLLYFEEKPNDRHVKVPPIEGYSDLQIEYHLRLMYEAGLLRCEVMSSSTTPERVIRVIPFGLTWQGHEFLDASRNETIWKKAIEQVKESGLSLTLGALQTLLVERIKREFGI
jgi:hypothetical protein